MNALGGFVLERVKSVISKKVGAGAAGIVLAVGGQHEAGWAALGYAAIQAAFDGWKYYVDAAHAGQSDKVLNPSIREQKI